MRAQRNDRALAMQDPSATSAKGDLHRSATNFKLILHLHLGFIGPADLRDLYFTEAGFVRLQGAIKSPFH